MDIEDRVGRLERANRRLRWAIAGAVAGCVMMAAKPGPKVITAQQFMVRDQDGNGDVVAPERPIKRRP